MQCKFTMFYSVRTFRSGGEMYSILLPHFIHSSTKILTFPNVFSRFNQIDVSLRIESSYIKPSKNELDSVCTCRSRETYV